MKYPYILLHKKAEKRVKNVPFQHLCKFFYYQAVAKAIFKRALVRVQKGVSKGLKEHLLQAKRASFQRQKMMFLNREYERFLQ